MERAEYPAGIKWTRQRRDVYQILLAAEEPLSAAQIYRRLEESAGEPGYAATTIYRILAAFEAHGLLLKSSWLGDDTLMYELDRGEHTHYALCLGCHRRVPLENCPLEHMHPHMPRPRGEFVISGHTLEFFGYCGECKKKAGIKGTSADA